MVVDAHLRTLVSRCRAEAKHNLEEEARKRVEAEAAALDASRKVSSIKQRAQEAVKLVKAKEAQGRKQAIDKAVESVKVGRTILIKPTGTHCLHPISSRPQCVRHLPHDTMGQPLIFTVPLCLGPP